MALAWLNLSAFKAQNTRLQCVCECEGSVKSPLTCFQRLNYECVSSAKTFTLCFYILMCRSHQQSFLVLFSSCLFHALFCLCGGLCVLCESDSVFGCSFAYHFIKRLPPIVQLCLYVCVVKVLLSITAKYVGQSLCS